MGMHKAVVGLAGVLVGLTALCGCAASTGTVTGVVRGYGGFNGTMNGAPMAGQQVRFQGSDGALTTVTSDEDGRFTASLSPGDYTLVCNDRPHVAVTAGQIVTMDCGEEVP